MGTILITGAAGRLGQVLRAHLTRDGIALRLIDRVGGDPAILEADLAEVSPAWIALFDGVDAVVHLAANGHPAARWAELVGPNIDAVLNVYRAAAAAGVAHVVLASSIWAAAGRRGDGGAIDAGVNDPGDNAYGASKIVAERIARDFQRSHGVATTILRIGAYSPDMGPARLTRGWDAEARLSRRDFCEGMERAIRSAPDGVRTLNLLSENAGRRFTLDEAREAIGFVPADRFDAQAGDGWMVRLRRFLAPPAR